MKILKIFGLVVGIHVIAFMFVFAIPGCRSTTRHSPPPPAAVQAERAPVQGASATPVYEGVNPVAAKPTSPSIEPALNPPVAASTPTVSYPASGSSGSGNRYNPTRPGTPVASALQTAPATEMTPASTHVVGSGESLWKIAKKHNLSVKELAAANNLKPDVALREGQKLIIPGKATPMSTAAATPPTPTGDTLTYKVKAGDSLATIAKRAGTTAAAIKTLNHLKSDSVRAGQELILPAGPAAAATLAAAPDTDMTTPAKGGNGTHHIVRANETLGQIAKRYGVTRSEIAVANNITDPLKLRAGQDLVIPGAKTTAGARASTPAMNSGATPPPIPAPESVPTAISPSPILSPTGVDNNPIAPTSENPAARTATPPIVPVEESNPVGAPRSP